MGTAVDAFEFPPGLEWVNTSQVPASAALRGRVTLIYFWTFDCVNCINLLADLAWLENRYHDGLSVIGIHTPRYTSQRTAAAVLKAVETVRERLGEIVLPLPETVSIIRTTGKEESGAAYCRGPAIVLPANLIRQGEAGLARLVAHEMFHVLSSHNADLRREYLAL